jgi:hypothetical protein
MGGGGLGNLADELADAWEQEQEGGYGYASGQEIGNIPADSQHRDHSDSEDGYHMGTRTPSSGYSSERASLHPPKPKTRNGGHRHRRHESQYDGSDYGNDSDLEEAADISPSLEMQMAEIESLARRGIENNGSENDYVIARVVEALRDLGGQSGIENNAMRYESPISKAGLLSGDFFQTDSCFFAQTYYRTLFHYFTSHPPNSDAPNTHPPSPFLPFSSSLRRCHRCPHSSHRGGALAQPSLSFPVPVT